MSLTPEALILPDAAINVKRESSICDPRPEVSSSNVLRRLAVSSLYAVMHSLESPLPAGRRSSVAATPTPFDETENCDEKLLGELNKPLVDASATD